MLERAGWRPFILLEDREETQFKRQFGSSSVAGRLAWRPYARLPEPGGVNIYDPKQADDAAPHDLALIAPPGACDCRRRGRVERLMEREPFRRASAARLKPSRDRY